jgi:hydrogenase maturation protease
VTCCVIGVGNDMRGDDGVGLVVARKLAGHVDAGVRVIECEGEPVSLLAAWEGCTRALVVDATRSGAAPGVIRRIAAHEGPLPAALSGSSTHLLGIADAIELARALGRLPERTIVYGIEGETFAAGDGLSEPVAAAVDRVVAAVQRELGNGD